MDYLKYVNIKQGTKSEDRFSTGNTLPLTQRPFGFASFCPQTNGRNLRWFYHPDDHIFEGFRLTHQPSPWIEDHGAINMLPQIVEPQSDIYGASGSFNKKTAVMTPYYLKHHLNRCFADFELTPTEYGACVRLEFEKDYNRYLSVMAVCNEVYYEFNFDAENNRLYAKTDCDSYVLKSDDKGKLISYFVFQFDDDTIDVEKIIIDDLKGGRKYGTSVKGDGSCIHLALKKKKVQYTMATSFISYEQALQNLKNDSTYSSFEALVEENKNLWNEYLSRVEVSVEEAKMKTFYSCMYRAFLFPHKAYEIDKDGNPIHFSTVADAVLPGYRYTDNGFWDTYRTVYPFYSIVAPKECVEIMEGFIQDYIDGGWLPCWSAGSSKNCMPSTAIDAVIADLAVKGVLSGKLLETAFEGMEKHANRNSDSPAFGRAGCEEYIKLGYVPCDKHRESVNLTLDSAYLDYCLAVVADVLGYQDKKEKYLARSKNYRNIFDKETGFMRAVDSNGNMKPNFNPYEWGSDYTEASAWQTSLNVPHDIEGLAELHGGREALVAKLDELFAAPVEFFVGDAFGYRQIHEMAELAAQDFGQCAISNQPSFHIPFMYTYLGEGEKAAYWLEKICREAFSGEDDGFPGDEDNGTMALWYVFANIGIYPICPGKAEYTVTKPLIDDVKILGKKIDLSGYDRIISHEDLMKQING